MQPIQRPVIRLPGDSDTLFTRIEPGNSHSSMVFKLRCVWVAVAGWVVRVWPRLWWSPVIFSHN